MLSTNIAILRNLSGYSQEEVAEKIGISRQAEKVGNTVLSPEPKGKHIFGTVKVNDRGQIVIPKMARDMFHIKKDDSLVVLGDETEGIAIIKAEVFEQKLNQILEYTKVEIKE